MLFFVLFSFSFKMFCFFFKFVCQFATARDISDQICQDVLNCVVCCNLYYEYWLSGSVKKKKMYKISKKEKMVGVLLAWG